MAADVAVAAQATSSLETVAMNVEVVALGQEEGGFPCAPMMFIAIVRVGTGAASTLTAGQARQTALAPGQEQWQPHAHHAGQRRSPRLRHDEFYRIV